MEDTAIKTPFPYIKREMWEHEWIGIMDWYNLYRDFTGHIWFRQIILYFAVILLVYRKRPQKKVQQIKTRKMKK